MAEEAYLIRQEDTPTFKKALARHLSKAHYDQTEISSILHLSQPTVSNYLSHDVELPEEIDSLAAIVAKRITQTPPRFHTCVNFGSTHLQGPILLAHKHEILTNTRTKVINHLSEAYSLLKNKRLTPLTPAVKTNIAEALPTATDSDDVASYQGGLIIENDIVTAYAGIQYAISTHLAPLLLNIKKEYPEINAIMNLANHSSLQKSNFTFLSLTPDYHFSSQNSMPDILIHKGAFGIEPSIYILGTNAVEVAKKTNQLLKEVNQ